MPRFVLAAGYRIIHLAVVLLLVSFGTFMLLQLTPGDPAVSILGTNATPESVRELHHQLGLDKPLAQQFGHWLGGALHGDVGTSVVPPGGSVAGRIGQALPVSVELAVLAMVLALVFAIPIAVWSAYREGGAFDRIFSSVSFGLLSVPTFVSARGSELTSRSTPPMSSTRPPPTRWCGPSRCWPTWVPSSPL
jgi:peptide/nickel transport system permease protein